VHACATNRDSTGCSSGGTGIRRVSGFFIKLLAVSFLALNVVSGQNSSWQDQVRAGRAALDEKSYDQAVAAFDRALSEVPASQVQVLSLVQFYKARSLEGRGDLLQAQQAVKMALYYQPDDQKLMEYLQQIEAASANRVASEGDITRSLASARGFIHPPGGASGPDLVDLHINFKSNQDRPEDQGIMQIAKLAEALKSPALAGVRVRLTGHTDLLGDPGYNQDLSLRRARTVVTSLVSDYGIDPKRLDFEGRGMREPLVNGTSPLANAANRRVAIQVLR